MKLLFETLLEYLSIIKWDLIFTKKLIFEIDFRRAVLSNKKLSDTKISERCFIVGNGPSLRKMDLALLKDEVVFTVNTIMTDTALYESLNSDFHILIDPLYYNLNPEIPGDMDTVGLLRQVNHKGKKPKCIVLYEGKKALEKYGLDKELDLYYIFQHRNLTGCYPFKINMCRNMPVSQNVVQAAIFSAIYMGYKKIYLIGCDMTSFFLTYVSDDEGEKVVSESYHAYTYSRGEIHTILKSSQLYDNEYMLYDYAKTFTIFKRIRIYAEKNGIEIYNSTKGGGLDVFKRIRYESLFE
jgi:hypothetical protein